MARAPCCGISRAKNTPTALTGQLIVFETLAALAYAYLVYQRSPSGFEIAGIVLLVLGVIVGAGAGVTAVARRSGSAATCATSNWRCLGRAASTAASRRASGLA